MTRKTWILVGAICAPVHLLSLYVHEVAGNLAWAIFVVGITRMPL